MLYIPKRGKRKNVQQWAFYVQDTALRTPKGNSPWTTSPYVTFVQMIIQQKTAHCFLGYKPYIKVGTLVKPRGGILGNQGTPHHIRICHHNPRLITNPTNHLNSGTLQVGSIGHPSILLLLILLGDLADYSSLKIQYGTWFRNGGWRK